MAARRSATTPTPRLTGRRHAPFPSGERLASRYRIQRLLGRGGMGDVYEARDEELSIPVAVKVLRHDVGDTREALMRLKREVLLARAVWHPNVCRIYDLGRHREGNELVWFLTMELLEGETLRDHLARRGRLAVAEALPLVEQMAAGLGAAHRAGVVHRDFSPANVMLVPAPQGQCAVVTDFGLARPAVMDADEGERSGVATVAGTPPYIAPERVLGEEGLQAADIYAFGVVLYQMVTGSLPFTGLTAEIMMKRVVQDAPSPRALVADLDERWEAVILRCLSRQPGDRFGYAEEVAEALAGRSPAVGAIVLRRGLQALSSLPPERDSFLGREADLAGIESSWSGGSRVVALVGAAGMGKTRLAVHFGWLSLERWPGGVWFCDLTEANDKDGIATMVARSLSVPLGGGDALEQLGHAIAGHGRCLIILDNFEQVAKHAEDVLGRWLERAHHAGFLVTSRERLELRGQSMHMVEPLEAESGMDLFFDRARRQRPGLSFDERDRVSASELVRMVDGMPLAIELAAARMRMMTLPELVVRVQEGHRVLGGQGHGRHATLRAAIDGSWDLLSPWERAAWAQCSVFEGGFTLEAAEAVLDLGAWAEAPWVVDVVQSLVDKSLLRTWVPEEPARTSVPEARFGMYLSLQQYARDRLREQGSDDGSGTTAEQAAEELHGRWYARMGSAEALDLVHGHGGSPKWWRLNRELENMVVACRRAVARGDGPVATAVFSAVREIVELRGPYILAVELGLDLIEKALVPTDLGRALTDLGEMELLYGRTRESEVHLTRALALCREVGDRTGEAKVLSAVGNLSFELGRLEEARRLYEAAVPISHENGLRRLEGLVRGNLAALYVKLGRFEQATREFETALAIHRECGDRRLEGIALGNLGVLDADSGRMNEARAHYEAGIAIHRDVGDRRAEGTIVGNLGNLYLDLGLTDEAMALYDSALAIRRELGDRRAEGLILGNQGVALFDQRRFDEARAHLESALAIHREVNDRRAVGSVLGSLAEVLLEQGHPDEARAALAQAEELLRQVGDPFEIGKLLSIRGELERRLGDAAVAMATLVEAETLAARIGAGRESELGQRLARLRHRIVTG